MASLKNNSHTLFSLFVVGGFAFLLAELVTLGHTNPSQLLSIIAPVLGIVFGLAGLSSNSRLRKIISILFIVLSLSGIMGTLAHNGSRAFRANMVSSVQSEDRAIRRAIGSFTRLPPTLAPLMLTGLSLFGAAVASIGAAEVSMRKNM
jgi:hypothetical protein